jgi:hypothetical protein
VNQERGHINCPCWVTGEFKQVPCPWHDGKDKYPKGAYARTQITRGDFDFLRQMGITPQLDPREGA